MKAQRRHSVPMRYEALAGVILFWGCTEAMHPTMDAGGRDGMSSEVSIADGNVSDTGAAPDATENDSAVFDGGDVSDGGSALSALCPSPLPESWIFCDDFESGDPSAADYLERDLADGAFGRMDSESASGTYAMEVRWSPGTVSAGNLKVTFGDAPMGATHRAGERFAEVYWRMRLMHEEGWQGSPAKLSRATMFTANDWSQGMIAHLWSSGDVLLGDPARCVRDGSVTCQGYNDFAALQWMGRMPGTTPIFATEDSGRWRCIEGHVRLNTPGEDDGVFEFWVDGNLERRNDAMNWRGSYDAHGINAVFFENYWNEGSPRAQKRWFDDLAIATTRIGCD